MSAIGEDTWHPFAVHVRHCPELFMKDRITGSRYDAYDALRSKRVGHRHAVKIQNLHALPAGQFYADPERRPSKPASGRNLCILLPDVTLETIAATAHRVSEDKGCMIILSPHRSAPLALRATDLAALPVRQRRPARQRRFTFQPPKLPPQHYRI